MTFLVPLLVSLFYSVDICLRASEKFFWYDELFTVYFAQLAECTCFGQRSRIGIDFNPPLFYWLTRACNSLFGNGLVAMRLPEIVGFWIFSLSLFRFVQSAPECWPGLPRCCSRLSQRPITTPTKRARMEWCSGFCGLAIVCWQVAMEQTPQAGLVAGRFRSGAARRIPDALFRADAVRAV